MFIDLLVNPLRPSHLKRFIRKSRSSGRQDQDRLPQNADNAAETGSQGPSRALHSPGFFNHASNFTINNPTMVSNTFSSGKPTLEHLAPYTEPGAAMDSSARDPPPKCHPGTRLTIGAKLGTWLDDYERLWNMIWLHGPAGTGKSAVAQTFAEHCYDRGRLGAAFFFSRPNERNKPETVIPTLAYQLAVHCRGFNAALTDQLAGDPQLLTKAPRVQLRKLIIEPLLALQKDEHERIKEPFMMILDGLDECEGEEPQLEFVSMINEAAQLKNLPLLWLICSRPEAHLEYSFSTVAYCGREKLLLDQESRDDTDRYLRDELARIKNEYAYSMPKFWPPEDQFNQLSQFISGLFIFASTGTKYIGDRAYGNPVKQLEKLLSILKLAEAIGANNPLANLDLLYTQTLTDVPEETSPITQQILAYLIYIPRVTGGRVIAAQVLCNFMRIDQNGFYSALRKLHSFIAVPSPEDASKVPLRFHHASFQDFLLDHSRSGRFFIEEQKALVDITKSALVWNTIDIKCFHANDRWNPDDEHQHASLPDLKWVSPDTETDVSTDVADIAMYFWRVFFQLSNEQDEDLSSCIRDLDFRYMYRFYFPDLANWLYRQDPSDPIVRTKPSNGLDMRLLVYMRAVIGQGRADPAKFPWEWWRSLPGQHRVYFFVGHREKTIIVLYTKCQGRSYTCTLNLDNEPSPQQIKHYQDSLVELKRNETPDREGEELSTEGGTNNPLETPDLLYTQILADVPQEYLPITQRILAYSIYIPTVVGHDRIPTQVLCNFLCIDKCTFYNALQKLHPVIAVPAPDEASQAPLYFRHASFVDFLLDPDLSGRFVIEEQKARVDIAKSGLFWHGIDTTHFHTNDEWDFDEEHRHASLPNLEWVSLDDENAVSKGVADIAMDFWRVFDHLSDERDDDLSSCIRDLDFRYVYHLYFPELADWLYRQDPSDPIVRTEPSNERDMRLLEYLRTVTDQGHADPAKFPWKWANVERREYSFIGHEEKTIIILITRNQGGQYVYTLNLDKEPSLQEIIKHQDLLVNANWNEAPDWEGGKLSMESETNNPLAVLDRLYTQILTSVPEESLPTTQQILAYLVCMRQIGLSRRPVQVLCNFLRIDKSAFYSAFQNLDSLISLPAPEDASKAPLRFRHASFQGFLLDCNRSGRFAIEQKRAWLVIAKTALFWHSIDVTHFHTNDGWDFDEEHRHASLPNLEWVSPDNESAVSRGVADIAMDCWRVFDHLSDERDEDLFSYLRDLDFRYVYRFYFPELADWLYRQDPSDPIVRTEPSNELDTRLLEYLRTVTGQRHADPAKFPWEKLRNPGGRRRSFVFVGHEEKTIIVLVTERRGGTYVHTLNLDKEPTPQQIEEYQDFLSDLGWIEAPDREPEDEVEEEEI